ncbi:hypothetical protein [Anaerococcus porci]|uniref:hypothetical protein n=1 Tax=Anaerococcus porci TaxID=2652269 RepID=UPI002A74E70C|nr:hypothetical protein [Anaerococcus porci]MDY3007014.1 hypothetical protein [Anaerococcus porci]
MKTKIKVVFKDDMKCLFNANSFRFEDDGFCYLEFADKDDDFIRLDACVLISEIKYLKFVEVEE